jgi:hypothetical protein
MPKTAELKCSYQSYNLDGWEGGIAVCGMDGPNGTKVIAIPRLGLSTCLTGYHDGSAVRSMLLKNRTLYDDRRSLEALEELIFRDFTR